jgi:hypothetical protein
VLAPASPLPAFRIRTIQKSAEVWFARSMTRSVKRTWGGTLLGAFKSVLRIGVSVGIDGFKLRLRMGVGVGIGGFKLGFRIGVGVGVGVGRGFGGGVLAWV